jgi:hypothetical protein
MKVNKALKRLVKIEALLSSLTERYLPSAPHLREALQNAKDAVARAKQAVSLHASSRTKATAAKADRAAKKAARSHKKASVKSVAATPAKSKRVRKNTPIKKSAKKRPAKKMTPVPLAATGTVAQ